MDFVSNIRGYVYLSPDKTFHFFDGRVRSISFTKETVLDYRIVGYQVLLIQPVKDVSDIKLSIYNCVKKHESWTVFPTLLSIKEVKLFEYDSPYYYLVLVHGDMNTCLWTTTATPFHFVRTVCSNRETESLVESNIFIDKRDPSQLYFNVLLEKDRKQTYRSINSGRFWHEMKFLKDESSEYRQAINFNFSLHDAGSNPRGYSEIDIQYQQLPDGLQPFITFDRGDSWKRTPKTQHNVIMLNYATVILGIDMDTNFINYSFNEGKTWIRHKIFTNKLIVLYVGQFQGTDQKALIVTKEAGTKDITFTIIDFLSILNNDCTSTELHTWHLPSPAGFCQWGLIGIMKTRKPEILCLYKMKSHEYEGIGCNCTSNDFPCVFGFQPFADICVGDLLSGSYQSPKMCRNGSDDRDHELGYVKVDEKKCVFHQFYNDISTLSTEFCVKNNNTDFIVLESSHKLYMSRIYKRGADIRKRRPIPIGPFLKESINGPYAFDFLEQMMYRFKDKRVTKNSFFGVYQASIYFVNDDIIDMIIDPAASVLIYLTKRKRLMILSLLTNFQDLIYKDVVAFKHSPHQRSLSFVTSKNTVCYSNLTGKPRCHKLNHDVSHAYVDVEKSKIYSITPDRVLKIQTYAKDFSDMKMYLEILNVQDFAVVDDNLYFLSDGNMMYRNMTSDSTKVLLVHQHNFDHLVFHRVYFQNQQLCKKFNCQFMCYPDSYSSASCGCPSSMIKDKNICKCPPKIPDCLRQYCAGYLCKNSKCLPDNVKNNGVDDCGDNSDENHGHIKCSSHNHLCHGKCITKDVVCGNDKEDTPKQSKLRRFPTILIICVCLIIGISITITIYKIIRTTRQKRIHRRMKLIIYDDLADLENTDATEYNDVISLDEEQG
ncbi:Sortilin-related receptor [Thelohanellus kitauei]|uniref:Sortilin-related receptor n=1 Tax=Thelohanellus kitauei TaxID=669202 RepID=A0A0C2INM4_THEKT|nr:Sortilin-related receptor [Thelohanellus kitauei]